MFAKVLEEFPKPLIPIWNMMLAVSHLWLHTAPMSGEDTTGGLPSTLPPGRDVEADVPGVDAPGSGLARSLSGRPGAGSAAPGSGLI